MISITPTLKPQNPDPLLQLRVATRLSRRLRAHPLDIDIRFRGPDLNCTKKLRTISEPQLNTLIDGPTITLPGLYICLVLCSQHLALCSSAAIRITQQDLNHLRSQSAA